MTKDTQFDLDGALAALADRKRCLLLTHTNPDPDAIAAALALKALFAVRLPGMAVSLGYSGTVGRAENRAMLRELAIPLRPVVPRDLPSFDCLGLVDTQPTAGNNVVPDGWAVDLVVDHHTPLRTWWPASPWTDVRPDIEASSLIALEYLERAGVPLTTPLATALVYGLVTDTMDLGRAEDRAGLLPTYLRLLEQADLTALAAIRHPRLPRSYYRVLTEALEYAQVWGGKVVTLVLRSMPYPDLTAEMADFLIRAEGAQVAMCVGRFDEQVTVSLRTSRAWTCGDASVLLALLLKKRGPSGGHGTVAGGCLAVDETAAGGGTTLDLVALGTELSRQLAELTGCTGDPEYLVPLEG